MFGYDLIEKNGTGIEKNGTGIEKNGTGIEKNGTGIRWASLQVLMLTVGLSFLAGTAVADVRGFVNVGGGELQLTVADRFTLVSGQSRLRQDYAVLALSGVSFCEAARSPFAEGSGTGLDAEGSGTGLDAEGSGTGFDAEGSGTGFDAEGSGTGFDAEGSGTGFDAEGSGTGLAGAAGCRQYINPEGSGTGKPDAEGSGTGLTAEGSGTGLDAEGSGTGFDAEGSGTGFDAEGSGTGQPAAFRGLASGAFIAEVALNGPTASVIVYGRDSDGMFSELAVLELPVIFEGGREILPRDGVKRGLR